MSRIGLGDILYWLFRPAVYFIDWAWGTDLKDCQVCKARRHKLNGMFSVPAWAIILFVTLLVAAISWRNGE